MVTYVDHSRDDRTVAVELHHPLLGEAVTYLGSSEAEARSNAWRRAMRDRLAGFRITLFAGLPAEPTIIGLSEGLCIPEA